MGSRIARVVSLCGISLLFSVGLLEAQTTTISTEYLMTIYAPLDAGQAVDSTLNVYNVRPGGWVKGPKIKGTLIAPSGDWLRVMPSGVSRLDVRGMIRTDDGALIYITYNGIVSGGKESEERAEKGEVRTPKDTYFIIAPTMETSSSKYAWLNGVQCIGKMVEVKRNSYVKYDIFVVR
ncbi:MAG TPA: DUF3237 domain-containing protein [Acidobacteriaceae bacterium]|jgi:hypothetical protein